MNFGVGSARNPTGCSGRAPPDLVNAYSSLSLPQATLRFRVSRPVSVVSFDFRNFLLHSKKLHFIAVLIARSAYSPCQD